MSVWQRSPAPSPCLSLFLLSVVPVRTYPNEPPLGEGLPAELSPALSGRHQLQLPLDNQLISFPTPTAAGR